ncbi:CTP synthase (glutamine hydrolyzing) [Candidatus Micrarchaeota archaeon]|nr:CTP synthase (glutamine hydrolyzing) [Candidatus Micrarchaeota archaeon]
MQKESDGSKGKKRKFVVVAGSLMSGLGKGIVTSSVGKILQSHNLKVVPLKFDGYLNVDCGTMNPYRHGEVFVLDDGTECDMDLGTYERFLNVNLNKSNSLTGGKIFSLVIDKERKGGYLGYDVQFVPHLTNEIKKWVKGVGDSFDADVVMVEVGGTVGDLENGYFLEAMRQMSFEEEVLFVQLTYVPTLEALGEQKTKPTQHANRLLASLGINPKVVICREVEPLSKEARKKIALYCNVDEDAIIDDPDTDTIYGVPELFEKQRLCATILEKLGVKTNGSDLKEWNKLVHSIRHPGEVATIGITGKYTALKDAYVSIKEALVHAGAHCDVGVKIKWVETTEIEDGKLLVSALDECDGIIVPGGFGARGSEGKIKCINYARKNGIPFLGLCFGLQMAVVEWARNECGMTGANSTEIDADTHYPVIDLLPEQKSVKDKGATMRLGAYPCKIKKGTKTFQAYGKEEVSERHRHRFEVNPELAGKLEEKGLVLSGKSPDGKIVEMIEWPEGFGIATQAHPEFKSRLEKPAPLFQAFLQAVKEKKKKK